MHVGMIRLFAIYGYANICNARVQWLLSAKKTGNWLHDIFK
jgi:hypothetical protein